MFKHFRTYLFIEENWCTFSSLTYLLFPPSPFCLFSTAWNFISMWKDKITPDRCCKINFTKNDLDKKPIMPTIFTKRWKASVWKISARIVRSLNSMQVKEINICYRNLWCETRMIKCDTLCWNSFYKNMKSEHALESVLALYSVYHLKTNSAHLM